MFQVAYTPYIWPFVISLLISIFLSIYAFRHQHVPAATTFAWTMVAMSIWTLGYLLDATSITLEGKIFWAKIKYFGSVPGPMLWFVLSLQLTKKDHWLKSSLLRGLVLGFTVVTIGVVFTNQYHNWFWTDFRIIPELLEVNTDHGFYFWLYVAGIYLTALISGILYINYYRTTPTIFRQQALLMALGGIIPPASRVVEDILGIKFFPLIDTVILALMISGILFGLAIFRYGALNVVHIAHNLVIKNINAGIIVLDHLERIIELNPYAHQIIEQSPETAIGQPLKDVLASWSNLGKMADQENELTLLQAGLPIHYQVQVSPINDSGNVLVGYALTLFDITSRKKAEEALRLAKETADSANQAKSTFLANMSHELRSPLNAILGFAQIMQRNSDLDQENRSNLNIIMDSGQHLLSLINQVLDLSKIEAGRSTLNLTQFDIHGQLAELEDMFMIPAEAKGLQLRFERAASLPRYIRTDELKLRQVLINLLSNAVKFTTHGSVTLRIGVGQQADQPLNADEHPPLSLTFEITDTGPGIRPEEMDQLFEAFVQTGTGQQAQEGTGLGLSISHNFIHLMGGELTVESPAVAPSHRAGGPGATFRFDIQVETVAADGVQTIAPRIQKWVTALEPDQPTYRILIVDDKWTNRQLLIKLLKPLIRVSESEPGLELREAENGQQAIEIWEAWQPHLIWMDMRMPVMDGYAATQHVKATVKGQATAIIALTASALEEERAVVLSAGCDDFLRKPFQESDIFALMEQHLGAKFVYEQTPENVISSNQRQNVPEMATALTTLPSDLRAKLENAAATADMEAVEVTIEQIRTHQPALADELAHLAYAFNYDQIVALLSE